VILERLKNFKFLKKVQVTLLLKLIKKVEEIIIEELERARPGYNFIAEEGGTTKEKKVSLHGL